MKPINYDEIFEKAEARRAALEAITPKLQAIYDLWDTLYAAARPINSVNADFEQLDSEAAALLAQSVGVSVSTLGCGLHYLANAMQMLDRPSKDLLEALEPNEEARRLTPLHKPAVDKAWGQFQSAIAKLRHLYQNMVNGAVRDTASAKRIAEGLLAPAIEALERATPTAEQQAASSAVLKAIREANMQLVRTGDDAFMLVPYKVATAEQAAPKAAPGEPRFNCWSTNEGDSWFDHPADAQAIYDCLGNDAKVGDEYELTAGWNSVTARYRITEVVGDGEEYEVECISHPRENTAPQQEAHHLTQALTDPENQPNQYGVEFGMSGQPMRFKIGNQLFRLAYETDDQQEFEFIKRMLVNAFSTFTPDVKAAPQQEAQEPCPSCRNSDIYACTCTFQTSRNTTTQPAPATQQVVDVPESLVLAVDQWFADNIKDSGGCTSQDVHELAELFYDVAHEGGRESVDDALAIVESFGPGIGGLNDAYARQVLLAEEVKRLREQAPNPERTGELLMGLAVIRELTGTQQKGLEETIEAVRAAVNAQKHPPAPATMAVNDDLRDWLVAISAAVADQDDRAAQAMLREILKTPQPSPTAQAAPAPLSESEYKRGYRDGYERRDAEVRGALV